MRLQFFNFFDFFFSFQELINSLQLFLSFQLFSIFLNPLSSNFQFLKQKRELKYIENQKRKMETPNVEYVEINSSIDSKGTYCLNESNSHK